MIKQLGWLGGLGPVPHLHAKIGRGTRPLAVAGVTVDNQYQRYAMCTKQLQLTGGQLKGVMSKLSYEFSPA